MVIDTDINCDLYQTHILLLCSTTILKHYLHLLVLQVCIHGAKTLLYYQSDVPSVLNLDLVLGYAQKQINRASQQYDYK